MESESESEISHNHDMDCKENLVGPWQHDKYLSKKHLNTETTYFLTKEFPHN